MKQSILLMVFLTTISFSQAQKTFYGTIDYQFTVEGEGAEMLGFMMPEKMVVQYGKKGMKMYFEGGAMSTMMGKIVLNGKKNQIFQVKDEELTAYLMGPEDLEGNQVTLPDEVIKEDEVIEISGRSCQKYKTIKHTEDGGESVQYIWSTEELKAPEVSTPELRAVAGMNLGANGVPGFQMKSVTFDATTGLTITLLATNLDFTKLSNKEFDLPKGYAVEEFQMTTDE
ncbi:MAG: hypothetical protein IPH04_03460 [Saprospirales bacterium]|nr:hypothetical protein [Saprospirales bacterium]